MSGRVFDYINCRQQGNLSTFCRILVQYTLDSLIMVRHLLSDIRICPF